MCDVSKTYVGRTLRDHFPEHDSVVDPEGEMWQCENCGEEFQTRNARSGHLRHCVESCSTQGGDSRDEGDDIVEHEPEPSTASRDDRLDELQTRMDAIARTTTSEGAERVAQEALRIVTGGD